ncbi:NDP-hexose 2,3-dehydratase family protein [Actinomadura fibrosa]|uniref:NDP-hexose 2,3-dehydratase family protein n=1 Tax=Actinomadura fibrosa TaxID=111802 RepID=A0ABW2Y3I4_9ACTN|nr:NDP-hexose 2,3-dehydratase family protein [Actinomadura fibrosa]
MTPVLARLTDRLAASARATASRLSPDVDAWIAERRRRPFESALITLDELTEPDGWGFAPGTGVLGHRSGRFFTVEGMHVTTNQGPVGEWWQPVLVQRDIAILGLIAKEFDGVLHFLLQAKMEPGNVGMVQLSPTVQATPSNYTRVHGGRPSRYVEYFTDPARGRVLVDVMQSEQGAWFHLKRNRNVVVEVRDDVAAHEDFLWLTLGQIGCLLQRPNVVNMDARTVLGCLSAMADAGASGAEVFGEPLGDPPEPGAVHPMTEVMSWLVRRKCEHEMSARLVPLTALPGWRRDTDRIRPEDGAGEFSIASVRVHARTREAPRWKQPLLAPHGPTLAGLVVRSVNGVPHALVRAEALPGYRDTIELGPTVRFPMHAYDRTPPEHRPPFLDHLLTAGDGVRYDTVQSEEGGRFLHAETRYLVVEAGDDFPRRVPPDFSWISLKQLNALQRHGHYLGIEVRSLLLCLAVACPNDRPTRSR